MVATCAAAARSAAAAVVDEGRPEGDTLVSAALESKFSRSIAMHCEVFEATISTGSRNSFADYVVDFAAEPPLSGCALLGRLLHQSEAAVEFEVVEARGPWSRLRGSEPRLKRLVLRRDPGVEDRIYRCDSLTLPGLPSDEAEEEVVVRQLTSDTVRAYNWMRFTGYLAWAEYFARAVRGLLHRQGGETEASAPPLFVDLGGGSGWLSMCLKATLGQRCRVLCTDIASEALDLAREDARANELEVELAVGDLFEPLARIGEPHPTFVFFNPPQVTLGSSRQGASSAWKGSPDVALLAPEADAAHFHSRFCREASLAPGGIAWLGVNWDLLPEVISTCCSAGWQVTLPEAVRDLTTAPSVLVELRQVPVDDEAHQVSVQDCIDGALAEADAAAEFQARAVGATTDASQLEYFRRAAVRGVASGQANLGIAYAMGRGVPQSTFRAARWLQRAAAQGHEDAQAQLGRLYASGSAARHDRRAVRWFRTAAQHGHARAQASLGFMLLAGKGGPQSVAAGLTWLSRAAAQGDARAAAALAEAHAEGRGVPRNDTKALQLYHRAAEEGDVVAQVNLGLMLAQGRGPAGAGSSTAAAAAAWFARAARAGSACAQLNLGSMLEAGEGVPEDPAAAAALYREAAAQGSAEAQGRLAALHFEGRGVEESNEAGAEWLGLAVAQGDEAALELLDALQHAAEEGDEEARAVLGLMTSSEPSAAGPAGPPSPSGGDRRDVLRRSPAVARRARRTAQRPSALAGGLAGVR